MAIPIEKFRHYAVFTKNEHNQISCMTMIGSEVGSIFTGKVVDIIPFPARFKWLDKLGTTDFMDIVRKLNIDNMLLKAYRGGSKRPNKKRSSWKSRLQVR